MAYLTQFGTATTTNTSLTPAAVLVGTFTNTARIRKLYVNVFMDQVKGGGDYVVNIRVQRAGAGSEYVSIKTTLTLAAAITSGYVGSIPITLNATDVMKVYLLGTAADSDSTADIIVDVNEEWVNVDASGRVDLGAILGTALSGTAAQIVAAFVKFFDVASSSLTTASKNQTGDSYAEVSHTDYGNSKLVRSTTPANTLSVDTAHKVPATLANTDVTGDLPAAVNSIATDAVSAASVSAGAVTKIQSGLATAATAAAAVWNAATASYTATGSFGAFFAALVSAVWNYVGSGGRTLTQSASSLATVTAAGSITRTQGDAWDITLTGLASNTGYQYIDFVIKGETDDHDDDAWLRIREAATPTVPATDGLVLLNSKDPLDLTAGYITINSATSITIHVDADKTVQLAGGTAPTPVYGVKYFYAAAGPTTPEQGTFTITAAVNKAVA
jgi:hypothetical protein